MRDGVRANSGWRYSWKTIAVVCAGAGALIAIGLWGGYVIGRGGAGAPGEAASVDLAAPEAEMWSCAMHPQIRQPKPGKCPICAMDLVPVVGADGSGVAGARELRLSEAARKLAEIQTAPVERRMATAEVRMSGKIEYDETRVSHITAWVPGRLDRLYVDFTGLSVKRGDRMVSIYSPQLIAAQEELLQAIRAADRLKDSDVDRLRRTSGQTVEAVREKLRLWGLAPEQISDIEKRGTASDHVELRAPEGGIVVRKDAIQGQYVTTGTRIYTIADLSRVWVKLDAYESDLPMLRVGQQVRFSAQALPGQVFEGEVAFIDPVLDTATRTAKVRVNLENPDGRLKPEMFVKGVVRAEVGSGLRGKAPLVIPASAPLITGKRAVVYLEKEPGLYAGKEIVLGPRAGDFYIVEEGLEEGQRVVTKGNFKIDSAVQILAGPSMMNPEGGGPVPGHRHGAPGAPSAGARGGDDHVMRYSVPAEFRVQLDRVYESYLGIHHGLSRDDLEQARAAAATMAEALEGVDMMLLTEPAHSAYMVRLGDFEKHSRGVRSTGDIEGARRAFLPLSETMYATAAEFGTSGKEPVHRFYCSMAFDGRGAHWLQSNKEVENPYYGSAMFRCGEMKGTVIAGPEAKTGEHQHD
jgi:Cu(I)/Ag(I) efflux system membrane fusion protein